MTCLGVGSGRSQKFFPPQQESSGNVCCQIPSSQPAVSGPKASFGVGNVEWTLRSSCQLPQGLLTPGIGEGSWHTQASSSGRPEANSWAVSGAPLRNSCLILLDVGFVLGLWDALFSNAQSLSCSLEVLRLERSDRIRIPLLQATEDSTDISSKDIYLSIQNLFIEHLLLPGTVQGTGSICSRPRPCPQDVYILIISGQEVLGLGLPWRSSG